ncbi:MAG TPA: SGNH/GDSL hydrolase family protein [Flavobacteriales bacterium]
MRSVLVLLLLCAQTLHAQTSVLFIGNSYIYSNDLPNTLRQLALSLGDTLTVASSAPGGYTLYQHSSYAPTLEAINAQPWDFVVLQEQSQLGALPSDVTTTEYGAIELLTDIEANWECTYPVLYMTWGRENGDPQNCASFPFMCTYEGMQQALRNNYVALANFNDAWTAPVGVAWATVRAQHPEIDLYVDDGSHPTVAGTYLAACVFYTTLFHESCTAATFNGGLDPATAATLRSIASSTVLDGFETWNLDLPNGTDALLDGYQLGPDYVTLIHNGVGEHLWTCTNGQSFTTGTVTFTFATSGSFVVTHTYNDPCGNSDTRTFTFDMAVGLDEAFAQSNITVRSTTPGTVEVQQGEPGSTLMLFDVQGRVLLRERIGSSSAQIACPAGLHLWVLTQRDGTQRKGKVLVH